MPKVLCPSCHRKLRVPDRLAGREITCPRCNEAVPVPGGERSLLVAEGDEPLPESSLSDAPESLAPPARLGMVAMVLGVLSITVLCLPFVGYVAIALSSVGLFLGIWGLLKARAGGTEAAASPPAGEAEVPRRFGERDRDYPLAGIAACLLSLVLTLLPFFFRR